MIPGRHPFVGRNDVMENIDTIISQQPTPESVARPVAIFNEQGFEDQSQSAQTTEQRRREQIGHTGTYTPHSPTY